MLLIILFQLWSKFFASFLYTFVFCLQICSEIVVKKFFEKKKKKIYFQQILKNVFFLFKKKKKEEHI